MSTLINRFGVRFSVTAEIWLFMHHFLDALDALDLLDKLDKI